MIKIKNVIFRLWRKFNYIFWYRQIIVVNTLKN